MNRCLYGIYHENTRLGSKLPVFLVSLLYWYSFLLVSFYLQLGSDIPDTQETRRAISELLLESLQTAPERVRVEHRYYVTLPHDRYHENHATGKVRNNSSG